MKVPHDATVTKMELITSLIGFFIRSFEVLSNLVNESKLIATLRLRAAVAHCALDNGRLESAERRLW